jgi:serine/threonine protein kinase
MSMIGKTLAHYEITSQLGKGGMGEVYQAKDRKLGRDVAIKVLPEEFAKDADRVARFQREAKLLASLNHPNIAAIHGLEESGGANFLVLELVEGDTLADRIKAGPIPVEESLKLALQIAEALKAAHEKGVIHRDLKPANIKVTPDGKVKVLDFGLAKAFAGDREEVNLSNSPTLSDAGTQQGIILGTASYMSPEQARGKSVDQRADIWAFGCVLYEMLAGRIAFPGKDVTDILAAVIRAEPEWKSLPLNLHGRLREVIERCLEKDARDRYGSINDARVDIKKVLTDPSGLFALPVGTMEPRKKLQSALPWIAAAVMLTVVIVGALIWNLRTPAPREVTRFYYELPEGQQFNNPTMPVLAVSPDGQQFVYSESKGLFLRSIGELDAKLIAGTTNEDIRMPVFLPDGKWICYYSDKDKQLKKIAVVGGAPQVLCDVKNISTIGQPEMNSILFSSANQQERGTSGEIMRVSANGGTPESLLKEESGLILFPQILPGGKSILFTKLLIAKNQIGSQIMARFLGTDKSKELLAGYVARYLPTGHLVYTIGSSPLEMGGHNLFAVPFDPDKLEVTGGAISMVENIRGPVGAHYALSDSGTLVYLPGATGSLATGLTLVWVDREGKEESLGAPPNDYFVPKISPDGTRVAVVAPNKDNNLDIWIWDSIRKTRTRLTFDKMNNVPIWTPDSKRIIYASNRDGTYGIYWKAADGTGKEEKLVSSPDWSFLPSSLSRDGKILTMTVAKGLLTPATTHLDIGILSMEGGSWKPLLQEQYLTAQSEISPDGRCMAYMSDESGRSEIYVRSFPEVDKGKWPVSTSGGTAPRWSANGRELFYLSSENSVMAIEVKTQPTFSLGVPRTLFKSIYSGQTNTSGTPWDISSDGKRLLMMKEPGTADAASQARDSRKINIVLNWFEELKARVPVK